MGNLGDALQKHAKRLGIEKQVEASDVVERATLEIAKIIPKEDFEVISFNKGVLKIETKSASISSELNFKTKKIKEILPQVKRLNIKIV